MATVRMPAATAAAIGILTVAGCASSSGPSSTGTPNATTLTPSARTSVPQSSNPSQEAQARVLAFVPTYLRTVDDLYLDQSRPLDDIYQVAVAPDASTEATAIGKFRAQGYRQMGRTRLVSASAQSVDLTSDPSASPSPSPPHFVVTACVDVGQVTAVDASGRSLVPPGRPRYLIERLTVVNASYPDPASWRVSEAPNTQAQTCGA